MLSYTRKGDGLIYEPDSLQVMLAALDRQIGAVISHVFPNGEEKPIARFPCPCCCQVTALGYSVICSTTLLTHAMNTSKVAESLFYLLQVIPGHTSEEIAFNTGGASLFRNSALEQRS